MQPELRSNIALFLDSGRVLGTMLVDSAGLVVEMVHLDGTADLVYVYGPSNPGSRVQGKQQRQTGRLDSNGALTFRDDEGSNFVFDLSRDGTLTAVFNGRSGRLSGVFGKL